MSGNHYDEVSIFDVKPIHNKDSVVCKEIEYIANALHEGGRDDLKGVFEVCAILIIFIHPEKSKDGVSNALRLFFNKFDLFKSDQTDTLIYLFKFLEANDVDIFLDSKKSKRFHTEEYENLFLYMSVA